MGDSWVQLKFSIKYSNDGVNGIDGLEIVKDDRAVN